jgi:hypothetical protein
MCDACDSVTPPGVWLRQTAHTDVEVGLASSTFASAAQQMKPNCQHRQFTGTATAQADHPVVGGSTASAPCCIGAAEHVCTLLMCTCVHVLHVLQCIMLLHCLCPVCMCVAEGVLPGTLPSHLNQLTLLQHLSCLLYLTGL